MEWWNQLGPEMKAAIVGSLIGGVFALLGQALQGSSASLTWGTKVRMFFVSIGLGTFAAGGVIWLGIHYGKLGTLPRRIVVHDDTLYEKMMCMGDYPFKEDSDECIASGKFKYDPAKNCAEKGGFWEANARECRRPRK
jgi:hypothetical protein